MTKNSLTRLLLILSVLVGAALACNLPAGNTQLPPTAKPMTTEDIQQLENQIQKTLENPNASGDVTVTLTQDQLNSIISTGMAQQSEQTITDPSVVLTNGTMEVYGKVNQSGISANLKAVLQPQVDANGTPSLQVTSMTLGAIPVPDVLKNQVATAANDALKNYLASNSTGFKVKSITITEGQMTVTGSRQNS